MNSKIEKQVPVAYRVETNYEQPFYLYTDTLPTRGKWDALYTAPQPCPECEKLNANGLVLVTKEDAESYCRILTLLGMEEEGSPIEEVERLLHLREGMVCGDCNDTGWLENRKEGRYPCTCMTEAEPYQILEAKCAELEAKVEQLKMVPMKYRRMEFNAQLQRENMELRVERDALAMQVSEMREALEVLACLGNGDSYGNSHGNCIAQIALALPDLSSEVIRKHDAGVLRKAAEVCERRITPGTGSVAILNGAIDELLRMAEELEQTK